jgi:hypothetical protein
MAIRIGQPAGVGRGPKFRRNYRGPIFGQQQRPQLSMSIPTGGFMGQNQIGGQSAINIYRTPRPALTPEELREQSLEDRAKRYQQEEAEFNIRQREAELAKRKSDAEEVASGQFTIDGQAVTRAEMDQYQRGLERSSRNNPLMQDAQYMAAKASMPQAPQRDQFLNEQAYQSAISEYLSPANKQAREQDFNQKLNQSRRNALRNSINQFRSDPIGYLLGGGQGTFTYSPDQLLSYLGQANQLFRATGQEGNFMDFILGGSQPK